MSVLECWYDDENDWEWVRLTQFIGVCNHPIMSRLSKYTSLCPAYMQILFINGIWKIRMCFKCLLAHLCWFDGWRLARWNFHAEFEVLWHRLMFEMPSFKWMSKCLNIRNECSWTHWSHKHFIAIHCVWTSLAWFASLKKQSKPNRSSLLHVIIISCITLSNIQ